VAIFKSLSEDSKEQKELITIDLMCLSVQDEERAI
jgi:hypothetical protein